MQKKHFKASLLLLFMTKEDRCYASLTLGSRMSSLPGLERQVSVSENMCAAPLCIIVQELCESRGGRPGLSVLTSLRVSVDVKLY